MAKQTDSRKWLENAMGSMRNNLYSLNKLGKSKAANETIAKKIRKPYQDKTNEFIKKNMKNMKYNR